MAVIIEGMEMPKRCYECFEYLLSLCDRWKEMESEDFANKRADNCPLREVKIGHCKDCKYFEYDSFANIDGIPIVIAHEICKRWDNGHWGNKTREDGYCFLFEPKEGDQHEK